MRVVSGQELKLQGRLHNLNDLMQVYEYNFLMLRQLAPELQRLAGEFVSKVSSGMDLYLSIVEQAPYTTTFTLTYLFENSKGITAEPNLTVRTYSDARMAEALSGYQPRRYNRGIRHGLPSALEERWRLNRFLDKWLSYALHQGHHFSRAQSLQSERAKAADRVGTAKN